jgi:hypothetical protein
VRLGRPILPRRVLPLQAVLDHVDDPTDHTLVLYPRRAIRPGKTL